VKKILRQEDRRIYDDLRNLVKFVTGRSKFEKFFFKVAYERSCDKPYLGTHFQMLRRPRKKSLNASVFAQANNRVRG